MAKVCRRGAETSGRERSHPSPENPEDRRVNPGPFNIFINDLKDGTKTQLIRCPHDTKLEGILATLEDKIKIRSKLDEWQRWA